MKKIPLLVIASIVLGLTSCDTMVEEMGSMGPNTTGGEMYTNINLVVEPGDTVYLRARASINSMYDKRDTVTDIYTARMSSYSGNQFFYDLKTSKLSGETKITFDQRDENVTVKYEEFKLNEKDSVQIIFNVK